MWTITFYQKKKKKQLNFIRYEVDVTLCMFFKIRIYTPPKLSDFAQPPSSRPRIHTQADWPLPHCTTSLCQKGPKSTLSGGNVMVLADSEPKTETPGWDLLSHLENSSKCSMALRLGSHWSRGPVYIIAISRVVTCKDTYGPVYIHAGELSHETYS